MNGSKITYSGLAHMSAVWSRSLSLNAQTVCSSSGFNGKQQNLLLHPIVWVLKQKSSPKPCHCHHLVWKLTWCFPDVWGYRPTKKLNFCLIIPQNISPKVWETLRRFFANVKHLVFLFVGSGFHLRTLTQRSVVFGLTLDGLPFWKGSQLCPFVNNGADCG